MSNKYLELENQFEIITQLKNILTIAQWDFSTYMPNGASQNKKQEIASLASLIANLESSDEIISLINKIVPYSTKLDEWQSANINLIKTRYEHSSVIDQSLQKQYVEVSAECEFIWRTARINNDFKTLEPYLDKVFDITRKLASIKSEKFNIPKYEILLDQFDSNRLEKELNQVFEETTRQLPQLINKITDKQKNRKTIPLSKPIDLQTQKQISTRLAKLIGLDLERSRIDQSVHPFCTGRNDDVRITTKYDSINILDNIFNILHEAGHGLYLQNLPYKYINQPVGDFHSMSFHESQSLFMEMQIGTSKAFLELLSKLLHDEFNIRGNEYSAENLYNLKTTVNPCLIRIDADEVTYPMHIIIRYEIEQAIINEAIPAKDLPALWREKTTKYLGITPDNDKNGCMQDIHWVSGLFGYFPTYYIGAIISSMLASNMTEKGININTAIKCSDFQSINTYLNKNLREYGASLTSSKLLECSTGCTELNVNTFFNYLTTKYLND
ncbi:MAG: carboxypeptidase M32 [Rickettsiaceae bacterium]